jgi:hypothetical protein
LSRPSQPPAQSSGQPAGQPAETTLADLLDGVRWDFDPARQSLSPLAATSLWFEDFPWEGEDNEEGRA